MKWAPIAVFVFNRAEHAQKTLETLRKCHGFEKSPVYVFCDGPRTPDDMVHIEKARATVRSMLGEGAVYYEARTNKGLARSIIDGVTMICRDHGRVIVIEDDLSVSSRTLVYLNEALQRYKSDSRVMQISAHMFPVPELKGEKQALFLPFTTSWGWATWQDAWECFDESATGWEVLGRDEKMRAAFDLGGRAAYSAMLESQMNGQIDSWAIRWYWSVFKANGLVLFPPVSYIRNNGFDGSGTHGWRSARAAFSQFQTSQDLDIRMPQNIRVVPTHFDAVKRVITKMNTGRINRIKQMLELIRQKLYRSGNDHG